MKANVGKEFICIVLSWTLLPAGSRNNDTAPAHSPLLPASAPPAASQSVIKEELARESKPAAPALPQPAHTAPSSSASKGPSSRAVEHSTAQTEHSGSSSASTKRSRAKRPRESSAAADEVAPTKKRRRKASEAAASPRKKPSSSTPAEISSDGVQKLRNVASGAGAETGTMEEVLPPGRSARGLTPNSMGLYEHRWDEGAGEDDGTFLKGRWTKQEDDRVRGVVSCMACNLNSPLLLFRLLPG